MGCVGRNRVNELPGPTKTVALRETCLVTSPNIHTEMEAEDESPDDTLIALTTHFAQVQFRLKQIISADSQHKESLLHELEEFAFQGCAKSMTYDTAAAGENGSTEAQQQLRSELMERLKGQLRDLEECARTTERCDESGEEGRADLAEKQQLIIEELRRRFDLQFGDLERMSTEEVRENVSKAVQGIKSKEDLVSQLTTQVKDLERYITFLKEDPIQAKSQGASLSVPSLHSALRSSPTLRSSQTKHVSFADEREESPSPSGPQFKPLHTNMVARLASSSPPDYCFLSDDMSDSGGVQCSVDSSEVEWVRREGRHDSPLYQCKDPDDLRLSLLVMRKTLSVMQVLTLWQCGGSFHCLPRYVAGGERKRYHSALRSLEMTVDKIAILTTSLADANITRSTAVTMEIELHEEVSMSLADSLRVLMEHGLINGGEGVGPGSCFMWGQRRVTDEKECDAWKVFQFYYGLKNGKDYSTKPDQLLSSSFSLPVTTSSSIKKTLLTSIHRVENKYTNCCHCAKDTKFRALVCEGFNLCHLAEWFRIIATHPTVAEDFYTASSFLVSTGFRPAIACLENLKDNPLCQPVQLPSDYYHSANAFQTNS